MINSLHSKKASHEKKSVITSFLTLIIFLNVSSQSVKPQVINTAGNSYSFGYVKIDWSVGEMMLVNTLQTDNLKIIATNGFLQPFTDNPADSNYSVTFGPEEIKIFPNPATTIVEINFLTKQKGKISFYLYDGSGLLLYKKEFLS
ncbi:MAG TPA: hypothetical protein VN451_00230, partial [Chitinophagaceae bacterium]|nr:hypothetical protein [Chitinophagaceae bacterium]